MLTVGGPPERAGLSIADGRIERIGEPAADALDFGDALLLPGAVDVHVHTRSYAGEGIEACTRAAAAGGVTTIVDMPYDAGGPVDSVTAFETKIDDVEREAHIDVALWATVPPRGPIDAVDALVDAGAAAFKLSTFETHPERFPRIPDGQLLAAFAAIAAAGGLAACTPRTTRSCARASPPSSPPAGAAIRSRTHARGRRSPRPRRSVAASSSRARRACACTSATCRRRVAWSSFARRGARESTSAPRAARTTCCSTSQSCSV